ncbi:MAG: hypothetical protein R3Y44_05495 [Rikenellaceae bacterium]
MLKSKYLFSLVALLALFSCAEQTSNAMLWGETKYYDDFIFKKYEPVKMERTLCFDFNEDAQRLSRDVKLGIFTKNANGDYVPLNDDVIIYVDSKRCSGSEFAVSPSTREVKLAIEFAKNAKEGSHNWYLKVLDNGGLDRVNEYSSEQQKQPLLLEWSAKKSDIMNPSLLLTLIILAALVGLLIMWILALRPFIFPSIKPSTLYVESDGACKPARIVGAKRVILSSKRQSQNIFSTIYKGKSVFVQMPFFQGADVEISPRDKNSVRIRCSAAHYYTNSNIITKGEPIEIQQVSDKDQVAQIRIQ